MIPRPRYRIEMFLVDGLDEVSYLEPLHRDEDPFFIALENEALYYVIHEVDRFGNPLKSSGRHFLVEEHHHLFSAQQVKLILDANLNFSNNEESDYSEKQMQMNIKRMAKQDPNAMFISAGRNRFLPVSRNDVVLDMLGDQIWPKQPPKRKPAPKSDQAQKPNL